MAETPLLPYPNDPLPFRESIPRTSVWGVWLLKLMRLLNKAAQFSGTVTFPAANTVAVTFDHTEPDTNYFIALGGNANETFYWQTKTTTGFTARSSNAASAAILNWIVSRT